MKLLIATPGYDGKVDVHYTMSLVHTSVLLLKNQIQFGMLINRCGTLLCSERNQIVREFLESDYTHILCIDADIGWNGEDVLKMIGYNLEFVAGVYPTRKGKLFIFRPFFKEDKSIIVENDLISMEYVPAGFMLIAKSAFLKIMAKFPELEYKAKDPVLIDSSGFCFFNTELYDGEFWGEDYFFCRKAIQAGVEIWCNPSFQFNHAGTKGCLAEVISDKPPHPDIHMII